ncbi:MAG: sensor histidine kinase [Fervidobacterium sp.]
MLKPKERILISHQPWFKKIKAIKIISTIFIIELISIILFLTLNYSLPTSKYNLNVFIVFIISFGIPNISTVLFLLIKRTYNRNTSGTSLFYSRNNTKKKKLILYLFDILNIAYSLFITTSIITLILNIITYGIDRVNTQDILTLLILMITITFTIYVDRLNDKIEKEKFKSLANENHLKFLKSQLNPHFLFNTLTALAELIRKSPQHAEHMLLSLAEYYRIVLKSPQTWSLKEEIEFENTYIEIQKNILYETDFEYVLSLKIPEDLLERIIVPSMLLQPLLENAIKYGIKANNGGFVRVVLERGQSNLLIKIENAIPNSINENEIVLRNGLTITNERIKFLMNGTLRWECKKTPDGQNIISFFIVTPLYIM